MRTLLINCSPKKRFCASAYFMTLQKLFIRGEKKTDILRTKADYSRLLEELKNTDNVVFCLPLYVDAVPSHVLGFLPEMEKFCKENELHLNIGCVANNGFIEGRQNEPLMQMFENFCSRSASKWIGGVGIGGGVMLNVTRIVFIVQVVQLLVIIAINGVQSGNFFPKETLISFGENVALLLYFNLGVLLYLFQLGHAFNKGTVSGKKYARILIPSFIFIIFADIFFIIISFFEGGLFKGWLTRKPIED